MEIVPLTPRLGAEIRGVSLAEVDDAAVAEIRAALLTWRVVFFREQHFGRAEHVAFARRFGEPTPAHPTLDQGAEQFPEVLVLDNQAYEPVEGVETANLWHTDVTYTESPPMGSILRAVEVPTVGGDTHWSDMVASYQSLSPPIRDMLDGLEAVHHNVLPLHRGDTPTAVGRAFAGDRRAIHPVVRVHPETGERALFVNPNFTSHLRGLSRPESDALLRMLYDHLAATERTVRFRWEPGSVAFWDNRATAHLAGLAPAGERRVMERVTIAGCRPVGVTGRPGAGPVAG